MTAAWSSSWLDLASCKGRPLSLWFPARGDAFSAKVAKSICRTCPVRAACLADALAHDGEYPAGIYGGLSAQQRVVMRRRLALVPRTTARSVLHV